MSTHLFGSQPPITVDRNGGLFSLLVGHQRLTLLSVAMIVHQTEGSAHIRYNSPPGITTFTPDAGDSTIPSTAWGGSPHHLADGYRPFAGPVGGWGSWIDPTVSPPFTHSRCINNKQTTGSCDLRSPQNPTYASKWADRRLRR